MQSFRRRAKAVFYVAAQSMVRNSGPAGFPDDGTQYVTCTRSAKALVEQSVSSPYFGGGWKPLDWCLANVGFWHGAGVALRLL
jgi:hypothetical protein